MPGHAARERAWRSHDPIQAGPPGRLGSSLGAAVLTHATALLVERQRVALPLARSGCARRAAERVEPVQRVRTPTVSETVRRRTRRRVAEYDPAEAECRRDHEIHQRTVVLDDGR